MKTVPVIVGIALFSLAGVLSAADKGAAREPGTVAAEIDREIDRQLKEAKVPASPQADDAEFLRRASLDITGRIPTLEKAVVFLDSTDPDKRRKLIDELLESPSYGEHFATFWTNQINAHGTPPRSMTNAFRQWLTGEFNKGSGWDKIVHQMLTAQGTPTESPASYFVRSNLAEPGQLAATASQFFLGVQTQCAECHNHPFTKLKQTDYWGMAVFFSRLRQVNGKGGSQVTEEPAPGKKTVSLGPGALIKIPTAGGNKGAGKVVPAKFLGGAEPQLPGEGALRASLADWVTAPGNPYFARAAVNRAWGHFFGAGFVNPLDDFQEDSEPSHPELLELLAREFVSSGHDLKHLIRCLCQSRAYQRSSRPLAENKDDQALFSKMAVKVMPPHVMYDSLVTAMGVRNLPGGLGSPLPFEIYSGGAARPDRLPSRDEFIKFFSTTDDAGKATEYTHGIPQVLALMNARQFNSPTPLVEGLLKAKASPEQAIERLFLATLSRRPTEAEVKRVLGYLEKRKDPQQGYTGVLWVLFNSNEFVLNH